MLHPCETVLGPLEPFLSEVIAALQDKKLPVGELEIDHVCFRCETVAEYLDTKNRLGPYGSALEEGMIGGRPILTFLLTEPIVFKEHWRIRCLEIPCPKPGRHYARGLEHAEVVLCDKSESEDGKPLFMDSRPILQAFMAEHPDVAFDERAINKDINADVSVSIRDGVSVKYHARPLYEVCAYEKEHGMRVAVPQDYFLDVIS